MKTRVLLRALWHRRGRSLVAFGAVAIACSLAISMLQVAVDAGTKLRGELRVFGANVALLPADGAGIAEAEIDRFAARINANRLPACSPVLETTVAAGDQHVALVGVRWGAAPSLFAYWQNQGGWPGPGARGVCLVGARLAAALKVVPGTQLALTGSGGAIRTRVEGIVRSVDQS